MRSTLLILFLGGGGRLWRLTWNIRFHDSFIIPQTVFSCRGSYGVVKGASKGVAPRRRLPSPIFAVNTNESATDLQKHKVKWSIWGAFCIWRESGDDLWERCLLKLPGLLDACWVPPGCLLGASWMPSRPFLAASLALGCLLVPSVCLLQSINRSIHRPIHPSLHQSINPSINLSNNLPINYPSINQVIHQSISPWIH